MTGVETIQGPSVPQAWVEGRGDRNSARQGRSGLKFAAPGVPVGNWHSAVWGSG